MSDKGLSLAVDAMGADGGIGTILQGCRLALENGLKSRLVLFGKETEISREASALGSSLSSAQFSIRHTEGVVTMDDKPAHVLRRRDGTPQCGGPLRP